MPQLTIQQALDLARQHHQQRRLEQAEQLYRQILQVQPRHPGALQGLAILACHVGDVLHGRGQLQDAIDAYRQALACVPDFPVALGNLGNALRDAGKLGEAIAAYHGALALVPDSAELHYNLANALKDAGELAEAVETYRRAVALKPDFTDAIYNLGNTLLAQGDLQAAEAAYRQALELDPRCAEALCNLGTALIGMRKLPEATEALRAAIAVRSDYAEAWFNLGNVQREQGDPDAAVEAYRQAVTQKPDYVDGYCNLGGALMDLGRMEEAEAAFAKAIELAPTSVVAHNNLGLLLTRVGRLDEATRILDRALAICSQSADVGYNLGNALLAQGRLDQAVAAYSDALQPRPDDTGILNNLGNALKDKGLMDEAIQAFRRAMARNPGFVTAHSNLLYSLHYHPGYSAQEIAREHSLWDQQHARPLRQFIRRHEHTPDPEQRLRIGYVTPDLRGHPIGRFMLPILTHADHQATEVFCYSHVHKPDAVTERARCAVDQWRDIRGLTDEQAADLIRQDRIHVLVDLSMHMGGTRILIFARKPAPVQVTYLAYPSTTGLSTMDYRLSDPYLDPPGRDESAYSEKTIRLPDSFWCNMPLGYEEVPLNDLPALRTGHITFGCLNNFCKINAQVLELWVQVLRQVKGSRLILLAPEGNHREWAAELLQREGVDPQRLEFTAFLPTHRYIELYHRIDLGLDSFPYNGHTTSMDSFWMGVPVVTLVGQTAVARAGWSLLSNLQLRELAGHTPEEFVRIAVDLAHDLPRLQRLRQSLRQRMASSPLMDAPRFARGVEAAYREMWRAWCAGQVTSPE